MQSLKIALLNASITIRIWLQGCNCVLVPFLLLASDISSMWLAPIGYEEKRDGRRR
jgi:hypothetical protein